MKNVKYLGLILVLSTIVSCKHEVPVAQQDKTQGLREPAQIASKNLTENEWDRIRKMITQMDSIHFKQELIKLRIAQTLVSTFDLKISSYKTEAQMDQLFQSDLYCKLIRTKQLHESTENQMIYGLKIAKQLGDSYVNWYYDQISTFLIENKSISYFPAYLAAIGQMFKGLVQNEIEICGQKSCVENDLNQIKGLTVNPLDEKLFALYIKKNRYTISIGTDSTIPGKSQTSALKPGDCFQKDPNRKPQATAFDWKKHNWIGSALPEGSFVFTYDDGPHMTYTRQIRDSWAQAGLAKPAFFWLSKNASSLPTIVNELNNQGHVIGSHSERHADLGTLARASSSADFNSVNKQFFASEAKNLSANDFAIWKNKVLDREINQSVIDLSTIIKKPVRVFRLPFGSGINNDLIGDRFASLKLDHFFWRVDSLDWQDKNPNSIRDRVVNQMNLVKKGIVLFHDIHPQSAAATQLMVNYIKATPKIKAVSIYDIPGLTQ